MRGTDLSDFTRGKIYALKFHANWTNKQISDTIHVEFSAVKKYCQRAAAKEVRNLPVTTSRKTKCGRHNLITDRSRRSISRISSADPFKTAVEINHELRNIVRCTPRTTQKTMKKMGLKAYAPAKKTLLTVQHKADRLRWSVTYLPWVADQWHNVIFSDESKFVIGKYHARYVRRQIGHRYDDKNIETSVNRGRGNAMVWGAFSYSGCTQLILIDGRMNANDYVVVLENNLVPHLNTLLPAGGLFQHDNAPIHRARATTQWLRNNNINTMEWPALSPDMNPIEHVWGVLSKGIQRLEVNNSNELFAALRNCWNEKMASLEFRETYIHSMLRRVRALHIARGSYTKY